MKAHKKDSYHGVHAWIGVGREIKGHDDGIDDDDNGCSC